MRLKKLKIFGFKSFAEAVHLDFDADVIGLVGPNGCGKSNIVDAVRWVLGEQSAKSLRAEKMYDVIFAGTHNRKALGYAEVALTLSDVGAFEEVVVARRLYQNGESEYLINKEQVRLKDIQALFLGTGVGKNAFSIFEQGKLDAIINLSPLERRSLFDEAAGIGKFLQNKKETLKHLEEVSANYTRIKDLHHEIDKRRKQLKKQSEDALLYQEKKRILEHLEIGVLFAKWRKLASSAISSNGERASLQKEILSQKEFLSTQELHFETLAAKVQKGERDSKECDEKHYATASLFKIKGSEERREGEKTRELEVRKKRLEAEKEALHSSEKPLLEERKVLTEELLKQECERKNFEQKICEKEKSYTVSQEELKKLQEAARVARKEEMLLLEKRTHLEKELSKEKERSEHRVREHLKLEEALSEVEKWIATCENEEKKRRELVANELKEIEGLKELLPTLYNKIKEQTQKIGQWEHEVKAVVKKIQEYEANEKVLLTLQEEGDKGAQFLLKKGLKPFYAEFRPPTGEEKAWAHLLKAYQSTFVVNNEAEFEEAKNLAATHKLQGYSIATWAQLKKITDQKLRVESEEAFIDSFGIFFSLGGDENNAFTRQLKLNVIVKALEQQKDCLKELQEKGVIEKNKSEELEKMRASSEEKRRKSEMIHLQENFFLQQSVNDLKKAHHEKERLLKEKEALNEVHQEKKELLSLLQNDLFHAFELEKKASERVINLDRVLKTKMDAFELVQEEKKSLESSFHAFLLEFRRIEGGIKIIDAKEGERQKLKNSLAGELAHVIGEKKRAEERVLELSEEVNRAREAFEKSSLEQETIKEQLQGLKSEKEEAEKYLLRQRKKLAELEAKEQRFEIFFAENRAAKQPLAEELKTRYLLDCEKLEATEYPLEKGIEESEKALRALRLELEKGGSVNLAAIDEAKAEEERFSTVDHQLQDMKATKEDIEKIIHKLDQESRKAFKSTFEQVRANFQRNFSIFFNGGKADLKFTETADVLEAGVEIFAEPPGKQMRTISLLSGGEKCMTSLAILFSIFEVRPAPFCILDEVDAPLDDANVSRFTDVLRQFTQTTQFIIVTHNKKTMAITDCLFGVSMEEKGVSKLLSISFEKSKKIDESMAAV